MEPHILSMKLKQYREEKGITQQELAELLEVSDKSISKWELGNGYPGKKNMLKISELLDISVEVLLIEEKNEEQNKFKQSVKYGLISYCIIFAITLVVMGFRNQNKYAGILSWELEDILKTTALVFAQHISTAAVPALIIGLVFYFYILPQQQKD